MSVTSRDVTVITVAVDVAILHTPSLYELEATQPSTEDVILVRGAHDQPSEINLFFKW